MSSEQWLNNLKKGDLVVVARDNFLRKKYVDRITDTLIFLRGGAPFTKKDGVQLEAPAPSEPPEPTNRVPLAPYYLLEPTSNLLREMEESWYVREIKPYILDQIAKGITYETSVDIAAILQKNERRLDSA